MHIKYFPSSRHMESIARRNGKPCDSRMHLIFLKHAATGRADGDDRVTQNFKVCSDPLCLCGGQDAPCARISTARAAPYTTGTGSFQLWPSHGRAAHQQ